MQSKKKITELNNLLPHGAKKVIAEISGSTQVTVGRFFKGEVTNYKKYEAILGATVKYLNEINRKDQEIYNRLDKSLRCPE